MVIPRLDVFVELFVSGLALTLARALPTADCGTGQGTANKSGAAGADVTDGSNKDRPFCVVASEPPPLLPPPQVLMFLPGTPVNPTIGDGEY